VESIEELKAQLARVTEHRDALLAVIEAAPTAIITLDNRGVVKTWNTHSQRIFGWSQGEALGNLVPFVSPQNLKEFLDSHQRQLEDDLPIVEHEVRRKRKDGSLVDISVSTSLLREHGKVVQIIGAIADITQRKQAQRELSELNQTLEAKVEERTQELQQAVSDLESFSYSVSHDLRSPLRAIAGYAQVLEEDFSESLGDEGLSFLNRILRSTQRMSQLIDDLLHFSKTTRQPLHCQTTDMQHLVMDCLEELRATYPGASVHVDPLPAAQGDCGLLRQVWTNLLSNALKYSSKQEKSEVWVTASQDQDCLTYRVRDNGVGFDMRHSSKLFAVFQRLHRADEFEGTGVGLAIVGRVIHRHGGQMGVESTPGQGTTFSFTLPRSLEEKP